MDVLSYIYSLPRAPPPNDNPSSIAGNVSLKTKEILANMLGFKSHPGEKVFGNGAAFGLKLVEAEIVERDMGDGSSARVPAARIVCELTVADGMINEFGILSGPCAVYLLEFPALGACLCFELETGLPLGGTVSTSMNVQWHGPAPAGTILRMVGSTIAVTKKSSTSRTEIYAKKTGKLLVNFTHTNAVVQKPSIILEPYLQRAKSKM